MKFDVVTLIWSIALVLLTFNVCMLAIDWQFTNTLIYKFMLLMNGTFFGIIFAEWNNNA
tara:strand:- start:7 stop:183 length:177 start_codon:yes stop_codon:yes gene_type:complete